ncbi:MAG: hypothetical protein KF830_17285 [Planctomycetes bacterium]|nr:hypothetical protein [Planctomycetota bacterium]
MASLSAPSLRGQSSVRGWADEWFDTESREGGIVQLSGHDLQFGMLRGDGKVFVEGNGYDGMCTVPPAPAGTRYVEIGVSEKYVVGLLSDGTIVQWGFQYGYAAPPPSVPVPQVPSLPPGTTYTRVACGAAHTVALRSDGELVAWGRNLEGQCNVPALPAGIRVQQVCVQGGSNLVLLEDGTVVGWGLNTYGQLGVPLAPAGTRYVSLALGIGHGLGLRSDGLVIAWGDNSRGQCNVPALPPGTWYTMVSAGFDESLALRSDQVLVPFGTNFQYYLGSVPTVPAGRRVRQILAGGGWVAMLLDDGRVVRWPGGWDFSELPQRRHRQRFVHTSSGWAHTLAVLQDGDVVGWGWNLLGQAELPTWLRGGRYVKAGAAYVHSVVLREDGQLFAWADPWIVRNLVPPLPPGVVYTDFAAVADHTVALRSDGAAVSFGYDFFGAAQIPALPPGLRYVHADAKYGRTLLLRSDGQIVQVGRDAHWTPPSPPPGVDYVQVAACYNHSAALRSDGEVDFWGSLYPPTFSMWQPYVPPPWGVAYVELRGSVHYVSLRRSDGQVVTTGLVLPPGREVPRLDPGTSYVQLGGGNITMVARVGPTSTYVSFGHGCAGSRPATRLVPRDTPRIGQTLEVTLFDLPQDLAVLAFGWQRLPAPVDLGVHGMPGCALHVALDALVPLLGQNGTAKWRLPIPNDPIWVGARFCNQALVLDVGAGNGFGAVASDAAEGVIGHW